MKIRGLLVLGAISLSVFSCKDKEDENSPDNFDREALLSNLSTNYILPAYQGFSNETSILYTLVSTFVSTPNETNLTNCQDQLKQCMLSWQSVSMLEFGPAEDITFKTQVNLYPADTSEIQTHISSGSYDLTLTENFDSKGLQALDFMLFLPNKTNAQRVDYYLNTSNASSFLLAVTSDLKNLSADIYSDWSGGYSTTFVNDNESNAQGSSVSNLVNALSMHYETYMRKGKVGIPLGVFNGFTQDALPGHCEAYYSSYSNELLKESVLSLQKLMNGTGFSTGVNGVGLDDYMDFVEAKNDDQDLSVVINNQLDVVVADINSLSATMSDEVVNNSTTVHTLYSDMQQLVPLIKVDLTSALGVLITYQDNDGD